MTMEQPPFEDVSPIRYADFRRVPAKILSDMFLERTDMMK